MKKTFLLITLMSTITITSQAQLKVDSIGHVTLGTTTSNLNSNLSVEDNGYIAPNYAGKVGISSKLLVPKNNSNVGISSFVQASQTFTSDKNFGVTGSVAINHNHGRNYGVAGTLSFNVSNLTNAGGAGIYATDYSFLFSYPINIQGVYGLYVYGATNLQGRTTAQEIYTPADDRLSEDVEHVETRDRVEGQTLANLLRMNVREFNLKNARSVETPDAKEMTDEVRQAYEYMKKDEAEVYSRRHFGLSAQELQEIYPDLVLKGQDGYLYVNYTELVPLLIQSIQELKAELDEVKEKDGTARKTRSSETATNAEAEEVDILAMSQNVPNPFTESTEIQLNIPQSVKTAAVFFYDMTGKQVDKRIITERGATTLNVSGTDLTEGMYLYSLIADGKMISTKKMILTK